MTMTTPYSSEAFHKIPDLFPVRNAFADRNGLKFVKEVLGPLIQERGLEEVFGVGLVHRHFDIDSKTKLVEFNNVTAAWVLDEDQVNNVLGSNSVVYETSWALDDREKWMPYEFAYAPTGPTENNNIVNFKDQKYQQFISEYTAAIKEAGYEKLLGLRAWPGKDFRGGLEITEGTVNIILKPGEVSTTFIDRIYEEVTANIM